MTPVHLHLDWVDPRRTRLAAGAATLLSSHAGHPEPATSDTAKGSQAPTGRQPQRESARRRSGPSPRHRTSPTPQITTASLEAIARRLRPRLLHSMQLSGPPGRARSTGTLLLPVEAVVSGEHGDARAGRG